MYAKHARVALIEYDPNLLGYIPESSTGKMSYNYTIAIIIPHPTLTNPPPCAILLCHTEVMTHPLFTLKLQYLW